MIGSLFVAALAAATVRVDFGSACGEIKPVHGVNCSPMRHETVDKVYNQSQTELAARSGVSYGSLKRFEQTGEISLESLLKIAVVLQAAEPFADLFKPSELKSIQEIIDGEV